MLTEVLRVVTLAARDDEVFVRVVFVVAILADNEELLVTIALFSESMRVAAEEEFVVTVALMVLIDDKKDEEAE